MKSFHQIKMFVPQVLFRKDQMIIIKVMLKIMIEAIVLQSGQIDRFTELVIRKVVVQINLMLFIKAVVIMVIVIQINLMLLDRINQCPIVIKQVDLLFIQIVMLFTINSSLQIMSYQIDRCLVADLKTSLQFITMKSFIMQINLVPKVLLLEGPKELPHLDWQLMADPTSWVVVMSKLLKFPIQTNHQSVIMSMYLMNFRLAVLSFNFQTTILIETYQVLFIAIKVVLKLMLFMVELHFQKQIRPVINFVVYQKILS